LKLPASFLESLQNVKGFNQAAFENIHASDEQVTSIRLNPRKLLQPADLDFSLDEKIPWSSNGYYVAKRPSFTFDPLLHAGVYYVQEASSMFIEQALKQSVDLSDSLKVLDLCAAPGGKSTLIQSLLNKNSLLVCNEVIKSRTAVLEENLVKWGAENVVVTNNDPAHFARLPGYFDVVVADAPCSGSGLFRRDPDAIEQWSEQAVQLCCQRQQRIIADVWPALREEGMLIYSTCSYSKAENEDILNWILKEFNAVVKKIIIPPNWGIVESDEGGCRFYPDKLKGEGFFIAVIQKKEAIGTAVAPKPRTGPEKITRREALIVEPWIDEDEAAELKMLRQGELVLLLTNTLYDALPVLQSALYIKKAGVIAGRPVVKDMVPHHELALSALVNKKLSRIVFSYNDAIRYLRRDELLITDAVKGWVLVTYKQYALGWVKILPGRVNNYYPPTWRILSAVNKGD
jgi:16S rRNA C967 or C1407 C5-methylase (RsmB/RsmF family)/NOL1/NOP2/fmu family ribosome biogenesis protein